MMFDALMHRGESLPHGVPATLFSRPTDFHASLLFAIRLTLAIFTLLALSIPSPFALSVAERSRRSPSRRSLRLRSYRPTLRANGEGAGGAEGLRERRGAVTEGRGDAQAGHVR